MFNMKYVNKEKYNISFLIFKNINKENKETKNCKIKKNRNYFSFIIFI